MVNAQTVPGKVGIATVLFNSAEVLPDFCHSLRSQTYEKFVVYAVDNASTDGSVDFCRAQGEAFIVLENTDNVGFARGTNEGIRRALCDGCEMVLILNNDVVFGPEFLGQLVTALMRSPADMAAPMTYYHNKPDVIWAAGGGLARYAGYRPFHRGMDRRDVGQFTEECRIAFAPGSCLLVRSNVFAKIGTLDETFFTYWEDTDFAVRALKAGLYTLFVPTAKLWHKVSSLTGPGSPFQRFYAVRNHALFIKKHCSPFHSKMLSSLYLIWYRLAGFRNSQTDPRIAAWKQGLEIAERARRSVS
jgi:GT2 family glycosyltransferase